MSLDAANVPMRDLTVQSTYCGQKRYTPTQKIKILIVEDQPLTMVGIKMSLSEIETFEIVGQATSGIDAVSEALRLVPDVVIMDISLPGMDGLQATAAIKKAQPNIHVIMFTSHHSPDVVVTAVRAGADGFLSKDRSLEEIAAAINTVQRNNCWIDPVIADSIIRDSLDARLSLTRWETQVLTLLRDGQQINDVAKQLRTTEDAVTAVMRGLFKAIARLTPDDLDASGSASGVNSGSSNSIGMANAVGADSQMAPQIGQLFEGKYAIQNTIGRGGAGCVYHAHHIYMDREVAIKMLHHSLLEDRDALRAFRQEAMTVACLDDPNVIRVYDFGVTNGGDPYLVMEYFEGETLRELLTKQPQLAPLQFFDVMLPICDALATAHSMGIVHCDLKPGNILVRHDANGLQIKLADFGLARFTELENAADQAELQPGEIIVEGTPSYMSPEQCSGEPIVAASDIYGLGCVMFESLTGSTVFSGTQAVEILGKHVHARPPLLQDIAPEAHFPFELEHLISSMLDKDPANRPEIQTVRELMNKMRLQYAERSPSYQI